MMTDAEEGWSFMQASVAYMIIGVFGAVIFTWMYYPPVSAEPGILAILNQLTGTVTTLAGLVVGYYFGSSKGSKEKDDAMARSVKTSNEVVASLATGTGNGSGTTTTTTKIVAPTTKGTKK